MTDPLGLLLVGLGNPGPRYAGNRHNAGYLLLDAVAAGLKFKIGTPRCHSLVGEGRWQKAHVVLAKPQTFMNDSGRAVACLVRGFKVQPERLLVVFDDLDLPTGELRLRPGGGSSGHHGMESIIDRLGETQFPRLRIGIGRPPGRMDPADFVLEDFTPSERELIDLALPRGVECVQTFLLRGLEEAMTRCNTTPA
jgi:PTH1 family peptidyl-tRNA hydrolase